MRCPYFFSLSLVLCYLYKIHFIFSVSDIAAYLFYNFVAVFAAENIFLPEFNTTRNASEKSPTYS